MICMMVIKKTSLCLRNKLYVPTSGVPFRNLHCSCCYAIVRSRGLEQVRLTLLQTKLRINKQLHRSDSIAAIILHYCIPFYII